MASPSTSSAPTARKRAPHATAGLDHISERAPDAPRITAFEYDDAGVSERVVAEVTRAGCRAFGRECVTWINVDGVHDQKTLEALAGVFGLHPLILEDVANAAQRPKLEEYDDCAFIVLKMLDYDDDTEQIMVEQISIVIGTDFVLTFQERKGDVFDGVRERLRNNIGKIRKNKADYLAYRLLDAVVDHYFVALDAMGDLVEEVEEQVSADPTRVDTRTLHTLKRETLYLRKSIVPARELFGSLAKIEDSNIIRPATAPYLRDVYDHMLQVSETLDVQREILASMLDVYHSAISNRMNEVMKVLSIVSTIFIPLSFIAGVYGMNFEFMPELHRTWGYPAVLSLMFLAAFGMLVYFKRQRWF